MKDNKLILSENKKRVFLEYDAKKDIPPRPIAAQDLSDLFKYYKEKHGITLIKNGDFSSDIIRMNKKLIIQKKKNFLNEKLRYAYFLKEAQICSDYSGADIKIEGGYNRELYDNIIQYLAVYLSDGTLKQDLSEEEMFDVNQLCNNKFSDKAKIQLDEIIKSAVSKLDDQLEDVCLTKEQAIEEIKKIRDSLSQDEAVGYIFTNNRIKTAGHFESIIITKSVIYKPIEWHGVLGAYRLMPTDFEGIDFYSANLNPFWLGREYMPEQQADRVHCGVLGISGVKRLLQNNAVELTKGSSLAVDFYSDENGSKEQVFIPSPIILQYSQSSKYIDFLSTIIGSSSEEPLGEKNNLLESSSDDSSEENFDEDEEEYDSDDSSEDFEEDELDKLSIRTLEEVLKHSIEYAKQSGDEEMIKKNKEVLSNLPKFRDKWQQGCLLARQKRDELVSEYSVFNLFLNFAAKRMQTIIATRKSQSTNQEGFFAESKLSYPSLLLEYHLDEGELASKKILKVLSQIAEDLGKADALKVVDELIGWVKRSNKKINFEEFDEFKVKLKEDKHGIGN